MGELAALLAGVVIGASSVAGGAFVAVGVLIRNAPRRPDPPHIYDADALIPGRIDRVDHRDITFVVDYDTDNPPEVGRRCVLATVTREHHDG